jgi:hypothetical protein
MPQPHLAQGFKQQDHVKSPHYPLQQDDGGAAEHCSLKECEHARKHGGDAGYHEEGRKCNLEVKAVEHKRPVKSHCEIAKRTQHLQGQLSEGKRRSVYYGFGVILHQAPASSGGRIQAVAGAAGRMGSSYHQLNGCFEMQ